MGRKFLLQGLLAALQLALLLSLAGAQAAPAPASLAPSWYDEGVPPGYIALYKGGAKTVAPFQGWVPPGYDSWFLRVVTQSNMPRKLTAVVSLDGNRDAVLYPYFYDVVFSWQGGGVQAYALPVTLNSGWNLVFLRKASAPSASGMWASVTATDWSQVRFGDASGQPENFLTYSIIWSNDTHAQVLVYAPQPGTYYLYWQSQVQVPAVSAPHPFYACYNNICGVRFNGVNQYAQSWVAKNWLTTNQSSIVWQFYIFPNQTVHDIVFFPTSAGYRVLQGSIVSDQGYSAHYVPAGTSGYIAQMDFPSISGFVIFSVYARGSTSVSSALRLDIYEDGVLVASATFSLSTSYSWVGGFRLPFASANKKYTLKIYSSGAVNVYIAIAGAFFHLGSVSFGFQHFALVLYGGVRIIVIGADNVLRNMYSYLNIGGRLQTVTITVNNTLQATYYNNTLIRSQSYSYGLYQTSTYFCIGGPLYTYFYGLTTRVLAYNRSLTASEVSAVRGGSVPTGGLLFYFVADPRYLYDINWDGYVDWQDLSGNGNHVHLVNFHARGSFTGAVYSVGAIFPAARSPGLSASYKAGSGRLVVGWLPFGSVLVVRDSAGRVVYTARGQGLPVSVQLGSGTYTVEVSPGGAVLNALAVQPYTALTATVTVSSTTGVTVAPHLYDWYFSGGFLYAQNSASLNITGAFTLTTMVRSVFTTSTSIATKRYYPQTVEAAAPPSCAGYDSYALKVDGSGRAYAAVRSGAGATHTVADSANLGDLSNNRYVWLAARYDGSHLRVYRNGTSASASVGSITLLTCPTFLTVAWDASGSHAYGYVSFLSLHAAAVDPSQVAAGKVVSASNLVLLADPTFWDGSRYVDLSGSGNHLYPSGAVSRVEAAAKWLWVVAGLGAPGGITFRFLPAGALVYISSSASSQWFVATGSASVFVALPAGTYTVTVYLPGGAAPAAPVQTLVWGDGVFGTGYGLLSAVLAGAGRAQPAGWLQGYRYRREVIVQGSVAGTLVNYPVPVVVYYGAGADAGNSVYLSGRCRPDFSDVVFTAGDGVTRLPVWVEEAVNGSYAVFWVQVPTIPAFSSTTSIFVYYGGPQSPRLGVSAPVLETFEGHPPGSSVTVYGAGAARVYQFGSVKALQLSSPDASGALTVAVQAARGGRVVARVYLNYTSQQNAFYLGWSDGTTFSSGRPVRSLLAYLYPGGLQVRSDWSGVLASASAAPASGQWYRLEVRWYVGYAEALLSTGALATSTAVLAVGAAMRNYTYLSLGVNSTAVMLVDWVALLPGVYPDAYVVGAMPEEVNTAAALVVQPPQPRPVVVAPSNPALQPASALSDPVSRMALVGAFVTAVVVAAAKLEVRLSVALALAGAIVLLTGLLLGDLTLVAVGGVLLALGIGLAAI